MKLELKYFGQISELTGLSYESIELKDDSNTFDLDELIKEKYNLYKSNYRLAINHKMTEVKVTLKDMDEVAFLPPFAGG